MAFDRQPAPPHLASLLGCCSPNLSPVPTDARTGSARLSVSRAVQRRSQSAEAGVERVRGGHEHTPPWAGHTEGADEGPWQVQIIRATGQRDAERPQRGNAPPPTRPLGGRRAGDEVFSRRRRLAAQPSPFWSWPCWSHPPWLGSPRLRRPATPSTSATSPPASPPRPCPQSTSRGSSSSSTTRPRRSRA